MERGKTICKTLKQIRKDIADANNIKYEPTECTHKGPCRGTCPKCEQEMRYIEKQLEIRKMLGKAVAVAGVAMGALSLFPAKALAQKPQDKTVPDVLIDSLKTKPLNDLAGDCEDAIEVRGILLDEGQEPVIGATCLCLSDDNKKKYGGEITDINGFFALRIPRGAKLEFTYIGYKSEERTFTESEDKVVITLKDDQTALGNVVVLGGVEVKDLKDDVYGHGGR